MRGADREFSIGERVAYYRRRRGLTQQTLAELVGHTLSWIEKIEHGRAPLDRLSVIRELARALDVSVHDLLPDDVAPVEANGHGRSVPALRALVLSYRAVNPRFAASTSDVRPVPVPQLEAITDDVWRAYQDSRFGYVVMRLNDVLPVAYVVSEDTSARRDAQRCLAFLYQAGASVLVKLGALDLARVCADRGDIAAQETGDPITMMSLQRSIAHTLLSNGQFEEAVAVVREGVIDGADALQGPDGASVLGTLMLVGATAAARAGERGEATAFLRHADSLAAEIGDRNEVWTSFGPTNVAIHKVTVAAELGDVDLAADLGSRLDVSVMPRERQVRHQLEVARALSRLGRRDDALAAILAAEVSAPEQVRRHFLTHELVHGWIRTTRIAPEAALVALARRLGHAA